MSDFVAATLAPDEYEVLRAKVHWAVFLPGIGLFAASFGIVGVGAAVTGLAGMFLACGAAMLFIHAAIQVLSEFLTQRTTQFAVTDRRILGTVGWINRRQIDLRLASVESVLVEQGLIGGWLGFGTLTVIGTGGTRDVFHWIEDPIRFKRQINIEAADEHR